jgi:hypothetical protein
VRNTGTHDSTSSSSGARCTHAHTGYRAQRAAVLFYGHKKEVFSATSMHYYFLYTILPYDLRVRVFNIFLRVIPVFYSILRYATDTDKISYGSFSADTEIYK